MSPEPSRQSVLVGFCNVAEIEPMDDTASELQLLRQMTPERKLSVMTALIRQAWMLKAAAIDVEMILDNGEVDQDLACQALAR